MWVTLAVLRDAVVSSVTLPTTILPTTSTTRVVGFAGAMLQPTPIWLALQRGHVAEGVYVSWYWYGSPAAQFGLNATRRITAIDGVALSLSHESWPAMLGEWRSGSGLRASREAGSHLSVQVVPLSLHVFGAMAGGAQRAVAPAEVGLGRPIPG